jgi:CxxC-x17-CxxC domain-containing protein
MSQRNVTEIKCSDCGKPATVPFKPTAGKPVYCRECLAKHSPSRHIERKISSAGSSEKQAWSRRRNDWKS